ncbi:MAG: DUF3791 domain-containing protein [Prevotella sp.]|nr:DUF3791 domain-containing protein [Prevotella sp.]
MSATQFTGLSALEIQMAFASLCVESAAKKANCTFREMYDRMKRIGLIQQYVKKLDPLHTQSREYVVDELLRTIERLEKQNEEVNV